MTTFPTRDPEKLQDIIIEWLNWKAQRCLAEIGPLTCGEDADRLRSQADALHSASEELGAIAIPPKPPEAEPFAPLLREAPGFTGHPGGPNGSSAVPR